MTRTALLVLLSLGSALAQIQGSVHDPQIAELTIEGRIPNGWILSDNPNILPLPPQAAAGVASGALEVRGRVEYNRPARIFRVFQMIVPRDAPTPLPQSPALNAPTVAAVFDMSIDSIAWYEFSSSLTGRPRLVATIVGKILRAYDEAGASEGEVCALTISFDKANPSRLGLLTVTFAGALTAAVPAPQGIVRMDPPLIRAQ